MYTVTRPVCVSVPNGEHMVITAVRKVIFELSVMEYIICLKPVYHACIHKIL